MADKKKFNLAEFLSKRTKNEKALGGASALLIFIALMHGLVIGPILSKMHLIDADISTSRDEIRRDRRIVSFKTRIFDEYAKSNNYLDSSEKSSEEIIATLLKKIENVAKQQSINVKDIRPGDTEVKPQFQVYKTSLDCEGTLSNLLTFMNTLEQSDYLFQITRYSFTPNSKGADILKASMDFARYLIPAEKIDPSILSAYQPETPAVKPDMMNLPSPPTSDMASLPELPLEETPKES